MAGNESRVTRRLARNARLDGRTAAARRVKRLTASFMAQLGDAVIADAVRMAAVRKAAELVALSERCRAEALRGGHTDPVALARLEGCADRAVRRLGLDR